MEENINIAKILKNKPEGTKLWTDMFGSVTLYVVTDACDAFQVKHHNKEPWFDEDGKLYKEGVLCIYPSKSMRDWEKFSWKRGDVLISDCGFVCIFKEWASGDYTRFNGCYFDGMPNAETAKYSKVDNNTAYGYIREIENRCGGKLNLETLEVEKTQPEFKIGDILCVKYNNRNIIFILSNINGKFYNHRVRLDSNKVIINYSDSHFQNEGIEFIRYATEEEKKQLFDALEKEGKAWDSNKKQVVDLKPKVELKPFDRCIWKIRNCEGSIWKASFVSYVDEYGATPMDVSIDEDLVNLIILPYNDQTKLLVGTTDEWEGGEQ